MTKAELVKSIADKTSFTVSNSEKALNVMVDSIINAVKKGDDVRLVGFGTFKSIKRAARKGRNPRTGEEIKIKASKSPKFQPGKTFKEAVN